MPPKAKFTKEQIVAAGLEIVRKDGIAAVSAREVGRYLGTSSSPVFSAFKNMEELNEEIYNLAIKEYSDYLADAVNYVPVFKQFGFRMIQFAKKEPNLFQLIYTKKRENVSYSQTVKELPASDLCIKAIMQQENFTLQEAITVFEEVLLAGIGICYMVSTKSCCISDSQLDTYLGLAYKGSVFAVKNLPKSEYSVHPVKNSEFVNGGLGDITVNY